MSKSINYDIDIGLDYLIQNTPPGVTLNSREIAKHCNCSESAIRSIERKALAKLRRNHKLKSFYYDD